MSMAMWIRRGVAASAVLAAGLLLAACAGGAAAQSSAPVERVITMAAIEPKGGVTIDKEAFPTEPLPAGGGYILKAPDDTGRWEVSTYRWDPGTIVVNQGDMVTLEMVGINGKEHPFRIPDFGVEGVVQRGQVTRVSFLADKAGIFPIECDVHHPTMQANLVVLAVPS